MAVALETVVKQLADSGIISQGQLENFVPPKAHPTSVEELIAQLVKENHLTKFQAAQVANGRAKSLILGEYTLLDKIGAGGMGQVFKAVHRRMDRLVAIKTLPAATMKDAAAVARFEREVKAAAKLRHPNVVAADDAGQANGVHFLVMEYVEGQDLSALVKKNGPFPVPKAVNYILQAARGLEFAHGEGVVHRDIKPANLLLDKKGTVKILDMGLARIESEGNVAAQAELTGTGAIMGTVDYMAPEQGVSTKHADARADIYSLGCTLHYLIIGKATYGGETVMARMLAHHHQPIPNLRELNGEVPEQVQAVFNKMVAKTVEDRYQTMTEVIANLERCSGGSQTSLGIGQSASTNAENSALTFLKDIPIQQTLAKSKATKKVAVAKTSNGKQPPWKNVKVMIGAAFLGVLILAGIIVSLRTKDGTLIVEVDQPDAMVQVLDAQGKIEVSQKGGVGKVTISVDPGKHRLRVEKNGFVVFGQEFEMESGGKKAITAKLEAAKGAGTSAQKAASQGPSNTSPKTILLPTPAQLEIDRRVIAWSLAKNPKAEITIKLDPSKAANIRVLAPSDIPIANFYFTHLELRDPNTEGELRILEGSSLSSLMCSRHMKLKDSQLFHIAKLFNLTYLNLGECSEITDAGIEHLRSMTNLNTILLSNLAISDKSLESLSTIPSLKRIALEGTQVTPAGVAALHKSLPDCRIEWPTRFQPYPPPQPTPAKATTQPAAALGPAPSLAAAASAKPITDFISPEFKSWMKEVQAMPAEEQIKAVSKKLMELNPGFDGVERHFHNNNVVTELTFSSDNVTDLSPVRALAGLSILNCNGSDYRTRSRLSDLSPLVGLKLSRLVCVNTSIFDLSPLRAMPLTGLDCTRTPVSNLSPLAGMPLTQLTCYTTQVSDLSPLEECKNLTSLTVTKTKVTPASVAALQKALPNCKIEWDDPAKVTIPAASTGPAAAPTKPITDINSPEFLAWLKEVQAKPAEEQVKAVSKKLVELNPGFDGKLDGAAGKPMVEKGVVTGLTVASHSVVDISPVRALTGLKMLCFTTCDKLSDLSPLRGMSLSNLQCTYCPVSDFTPLNGMPLTRLSISGPNISDLTSLHGMRLTTLSFGNTKVSDLSPLRGMPLMTLECFGTQVFDISPLKGMPLVILHCRNTSVSDLSPLEDCKSLTSLNVTKTKVTPAAVAALQKALPNCKIEWDDPAKPTTLQPAASGTK